MYIVQLFTATPFESHANTLSSISEHPYDVSTSASDWDQMRLDGEWVYVECLEEYKRAL